MRQALLLIAWGGLLAAEPALRVRVYDYRGGPAGQLAPAEEEAGRVFRQAGFEVAWVDCRRAECETQLGPRDIVLRLLPRRPAGESGLGYAVPGPYATVYASEVSAMARAASVEPSVLLGVAMAHEIGHVLLGPDSHSNTGIMKGRWRPKDLEAAAQRALRFTPIEALKLRAEVRSRTEKALSVRALPGSERVP